MTSKAPDRKRCAVREAPLVRGQVVIPTISTSGAPVPSYPDERVELRQDITVGVQGDNEHGWTLSFRAEDGNVYYRVETRVIDNNA